jgi:hypothetical protein
MDILDELNYKHKLFKLRLITKDINLFNFQVTSDNWDKLAKALEDDLHREEEFVFVHPTSNSTEYKRHYVHCPVNGNTVIFVGKMREPGDFATVRITLHSLYYKQPYMVIEDYKKSFSNPDIPAEMVRSAFNWALRNEGLEVILKPWDTSGEPVYWMMDNWVSYVHDLRKHPEIGAMCMGFEEALAERKQKEAIEKAKMEKKVKKKVVRSGTFENYIRIPKKAALMNFIKDKTIGQHSPKDVALLFRLALDLKMTYRIPYSVVVGFISGFKDKIKENRYNEWTNKQRSSYKGYQKYEDLKDELENLLKSD